MKIKNYYKLATTKLRRQALQIAEAGLVAIDTPRVIRATVRRVGNTLQILGQSLRVSDFSKIYVVGIGKCALEAAGALEKILGRDLSGGIVVDVHPGKLRRIRTYAGSHPLPTPRNVDITKQIIKLLSKATKKDLVIFLVSGGGSSLLCQPGNFTCQQEALLEQVLQRAGATIREINTVRKHLSLARGGNLAKHAYPAKVISLIFSDVTGNDLEFVASGPTVRDTTTVLEARKVLQKLDMPKACQALGRELLETPKAAKYFREVKNILVVTNRTALLAMAACARSLGLRPKIVSSRLMGEVGRVSGKIARSLHGAKIRTAYLYGGETTVQIKGSGKGGRNQELSLAALPDIRARELILSLASDGRDNTPLAGGICDIITKDIAAKKGLNPLKFLSRNASYEFFQKSGQGLRTGDTGSNVSDLIIALKS